jgi:hypothetical protein
MRLEQLGSADAIFPLSTGQCTTMFCVWDTYQVMTDEGIWSGFEMRAEGDVSQSKKGPQE